jgi:hypothetical protein
LVFHVWPRAIKNLLLDRGRSARYAQKQERTCFFSNVTTVLPSSCVLRDHPGSLSVSEGHCRDRIPG